MALPFNGRAIRGAIQPPLTAALNVRLPSSSSSRRARSFSLARPQAFRARQFFEPWVAVARHALSHIPPQADSSWRAGLLLMLLRLQAATQSLSVPTA